MKKYDVAAFGMVKLGHKAAFIGKVGNDSFGAQLRNAIEEAGIQSEGLYMDDHMHMTLALVHTKPDGLLFP